MSEVSLRLAVVEKIYVSNKKSIIFLCADQTVSVKFGWRVSRVSNNPEMVGVVVGEIQVFLPPFTNGYRTPNSISLKAGKSIIGTIQEWWELSEICDDENYKNGDNRNFG
ncbi:hypothetical protein RUM44_003775 [Polyplax serrata]|uniref:Uncharacterized protein n=1 Tax=Polyplax serrata TaxID=468196 RepID=A0ABR1AHF4_POLSC